MTLRTFLLFDNGELAVEGVEFSDGTKVLHWTHPETTIYAPDFDFSQALGLDLMELWRMENATIQLIVDEKYDSEPE